MRPRSGVSQWTMRLVSVSGRVRRIRPVVRWSMREMAPGECWEKLGSGGQSRFYPSALRGRYSGATAPRLMMNLMPSATDISNLTTSVSGTNTRKPLVGFGVVGTKTLTIPAAVFDWNSGLAAPVRKPTEYWPALGNCTSTTCLKEDLLLDTNASLTCFKVP